MPADDYKTFSLRVPVETFDKIKTDAITFADGNVNQYVLSWLPETYDLTTTQTETTPKQAPNNSR